MRALLITAATAACSKAPPTAPAQIVDLSTSVGELARAFDARAGEPRFVTLLSPS